MGIEKIICVSDIHTHNFPKIEECDLLIIGGDLFSCNVDQYDYQAMFLDKIFRKWLEVIPARHIVGIAGNHDSIFEHKKELVPSGLRWTYLEDSLVEIEGIKIWGSPWSLRFYDFSFYPPEEVDGEYWLEEEKYKLIPEGIDILISHGPMKGILDYTYRGEHFGSFALRNAVDRICPKLLVCGHMHEPGGELYRYGSTLVANASVTKIKYGFYKLVNNGILLNWSQISEYKKDI